MVSRVFHFTKNDGTTISFPRFDLEDLENLCDQYKSDLKTMALKSASDDKLTQEQIWNLKHQIDSRPVTVDHLFGATRVPKWIKIFLSHSLKKEGIPAKEHKEIISHLTTNQRIEVAEQLILDVPEVEKFDDNKKEESKEEDKSPLK